MRDFLKKAVEFMHGRYGHDKLNMFIWIVAGALYLINLLFIRNPIMIIIILLLIGLATFRSLSTNITKRMYENTRFINIFNGTKDFFKTQWMKIKEFKTHRYLRCPYCKALLRLKKRTGVQKIHCPRCGEDFKKNILF